MMTDHQWLMTSQALNTLRKLRKRIQAEFGITLRFSDFDFESHLAALKHRTQDEQSRALIAELEGLRGSPFQTDDEGAPRLYRGRQVLVEEEKKQDIYEMIYGDELALHGGQDKKPDTPVKMYRGRAVSS
ncbi:hypothetical protein KUV95_02065 [Microbulbifer agarilyticus]|uniref:hypothetical protein n=1 Tax=Microbulbifer agarilyticus TaxID=260552 RepID=UPI001C94F2E3|nr:hypothetical protein [Microbulbifer agarilyticus]MBY6210328.1 hypothetical protein [Microbulbifer agarilyticus]